MPAPALTRRRLLVAAGGGAVTLAGGGALLAGGTASPAQASPPVALGSVPRGLPDHQHAWNATLRADRHGNRTAPRHHALLLFAADHAPTLREAHALEAALRRVDRAYPAGPGGVLVLAGWGPGHFARVGLESPVPKAVALSTTEAPELEDPALCLHVAADDPATVARVTKALVLGDALPGQAADARTGTRAAGLRLASQRTGVTGKGLARKAVKALELPEGVEPPEGSPLMMGFTSGFRRSQARESDVTIADGPWAGGTTMHVSQLALSLTSWYSSLSDEQRIARMFAPGTSREQVDGAGAGITPPTAPIERVAREHGVIGHAQAAAAVRRNGRPRILRRDFNGVVDGQPVAHFVSLQRGIEDLVATRAAMDADLAQQANPAVGPQVNNGINEWLTVHRRANLLVPPRSRRTFPGLSGWDRA